MSKGNASVRLLGVSFGKLVDAKINGAIMNRLMRPFYFLLFWFQQLTPLLLLLLGMGFGIHWLWQIAHLDWLSLPHQLQPQKIAMIAIAVAAEMATFLPIWLFKKRRKANLWNGFLLVLMLIPVTLGLIFVSLAWEL